MRYGRMRLLAIVICASLWLSGCMQADLGIEIYQDGSGKLSITARIDREQYVSSLLEMYEAMGEPISQKDIEDAADDAMRKEGYQIVSVDGKAYYQIAQSQAIPQGELQTAFGDENLSSYVTTDTFYLMMDSKSARESLNHGTDVPADSVTYTVTVQLPDAIADTNGVIDAANPRQASFSGERPSCSPPRLTA